MTRSFRPGCWRHAVLAALAVGLLAGCGGSSPVKPGEYVKSMCSALGNWRNTIQSAGVALQSSGAATAARPVAKADYERFVSALVTATQRADGALRSAGIPAVSGGKLLATRLNQAFDTASRRLGHAESQAKAIQTSSAASFQLGASSVTSQIRSALEGIVSVSPGSSAQLRQAAAREPACRVLRISG